MIAPVRIVALVSVAAVALGLGIALGSETFGGLVPCALCLWERWPYRVALILGLVALIAPARIATPVLWLVLLAAVAAAALAGAHVGVEQGFWPSPLPECASRSPVGGSVAERLARLPALPAKPCDDPTYLVSFIRLSMAAMNLIYALAVAASLLIFLGSNRRPPR